MSLLLKCLIFAVLSLAAVVPKSQAAAAPESKATTIWPVIPFFPLGDLGQYQKTMSQDRDQVRRMFWDELMGALEKMADKGAIVEAMVEPMANILMMFDQVHDIHKAQDVISVDQSLEAQFKASLDRLFEAYDVREDRRRVELSYGSNPNLLPAFIREISTQQPLGQPVKSQQLNGKIANLMYEEIDVVAYGTFSSLGRGQFQVTLHLTGHKNGITRSFVAIGRLTDAVNSLALQVFDFFQKNVYPDWETPEKQLQWLPMPVNANKVEGYTWEEARQYCRVRGYRLPYSRELLLAESGGLYKEGGIPPLQVMRPYSVADKRSVNDNSVLTPGHEAATGGPVQGASYSMSKGLFWCVKGPVSSEVQIFETVWELIRKHRGDREVYRALETVRYELGDFGSNSAIYWGPSLITLERMESLSEALRYLKTKGINLVIPASFQ